MTLNWAYWSGWFVHVLFCRQSSSLMYPHRFSSALPSSTDVGVPERMNPHGGFQGPSSFIDFQNPQSFLSLANISPGSFSSWTPTTYSSPSTLSALNHIYRSPVNNPMGRDFSAAAAMSSIGKRIDDSFFWWQFSIEGNWTDKENKREESGEILIIIVSMSETDRGRLGGARAPSVFWKKIVDTLKKKFLVLGHTGSALPVFQTSVCHWNQGAYFKTWNTLKMFISYRFPRNSRFPVFWITFRRIFTHWLSRL